MLHGCEKLNIIFLSAPVTVFCDVTLVSTFYNNNYSIPQRNSIAKGRKEKEQEIVREQDICADPAVRVLMLNN